jgi:hypothetical protein
VLTVAPSAVVAVTVMVDGPVGVGAGPELDVHPTSAPAARTSIPRVRYIGARRNCTARWRNPNRMPIIASKMQIIPRADIDSGPRPILPGREGADPLLPFLVGIALIVIDVVVAVVP